MARIWPTPATPNQSQTLAKEQRGPGSPAAARLPQVLSTCLRPELSSRSLCKPRHSKGICYVLLGNQEQRNQRPAADRFWF